MVLTSPHSQKLHSNTFLSFILPSTINLVDVVSNTAAMILSISGTAYFVNFSISIFCWHTRLPCPQRRIVGLLWQQLLHGFDLLFGPACHRTIRTKLSCKSRWQRHWRSLHRHGCRRHRTRIQLRIQLWKSSVAVTT